MDFLECINQFINIGVGEARCLCLAALNVPNVIFYLLNTFMASTLIDERVLKSMALSSIAEINVILGQDCFLAKKYLVHSRTKHSVAAQQLEAYKQV